MIFSCVRTAVLCILQSHLRCASTRGSFSKLPLPHLWRDVVFSGFGIGGILKKNPDEENRRGFLKTSTKRSEAEGRTSKGRHNCPSTFCRPSAFCFVEDLTVFSSFGSVDPQHYPSHPDRMTSPRATMIAPITTRTMRLFSVLQRSARSGETP